jgi:DNA-binding CsgD family transcriptional regulator
VEAAAPRRFVRGGRSALVVCSRDGEVLEWSPRAQQLALLAAVDSINLDAPIDGADFVEARRVLREAALALAARIDDDSGPMPVLTLRNGWGEFALHGYRLQPQHGADSRLGVLIEQLVPFEAHLLERVNATGLSTRQREVALLSAQGLMHAQIAKALHLTPQTVKDYVKDIYARLNIGSREELLRELGAMA